MRHLLPFAALLRTEVGAYQLRGRLRVEHIGIARLQILQAPHLTVELHVGDNGTAEHIVTIVMLRQLLAQLPNLLPLRGFYVIEECHHIPTFNVVTLPL